MSGSTTELSLATVVDSDDNADYLTLSLANSLRTVDALFNNLTGHNHGGAHQGAAVAPAAIPGGSITNAQLGPDVARANLLTNGGFEIWQRGIGAFTGNGTISADRWAIQVNGTDNLVVTKDGSNQDNVNGSVFAAQCTFTKGTGSNANLQQLLKTSEHQIRGRAVSFSVRVLTTVAAGCYIGIGSDGTPAVSSSSTPHTGTGQYQTLTTTATIPSNATVVFFYIFLGASGVYILDNAMLVVGSQPGDYAPLHPADDLARCLRYYERLDKPNGAALVQAFAYGVGSAAFLFHYKAVKAAVPTISYVGAAAYTLTNATATPIAATAISTSAVDSYSLQGQVSVASGLVAGNASLLGAGAAGANFIIEANP